MDQSSERKENSSIITSWKEFLDEFEKMICTEASILKKYVTIPETPFSSTLFDSPFYVKNANERKPGRDRPGIYIFILLEDVSLTDEQVRQWNSVEGAGFKKYGATELATGDCLYLGSTEKSLMHRLGQHFGPLIPKGGPHGLALSTPQRQVLSEKVQAIVFPLQVRYEQYASMLLTRIEKKLHSTMMPKAGSNKV